MKTLRKIAWNKSLRCLFAVAVLFYALFPQTGFCTCPGCNCSNKLPAAKDDKATTPETDEGCCCCRAKTEPVGESVRKASCCSEESDGHSPDGCPCSCSETKLPPPPVQKTGGQTLQDLDHSKDVQTIPFVFPLIPEVVDEIVFVEKTFETPISRLPLRLHLLLLVMLN